LCQDELRLKRRMPRHKLIFARRNGVGVAGTQRNKGYPGPGGSMTAVPWQQWLPGQFCHFHIPIELPG